jgi:hypothetical protein
MDDRERRRETAERHGWQPGERERMQAAISERERQIEREAREARRSDSQREAPAAEPRTDEDEPADVAQADATAQWTRWVRRQIDKRLARETETITAAVAEVLASERSRTSADIAALQRQVADLGARLGRIEQARSTPGLRAVGE